VNENVKTACALLLAAAGAAGCPRGEAPVVLGVDQSLKDLGLAEFLQAAYETEHKERLSLTYLDTGRLEAAVLAGEVDTALVMSEATRAALEADGAPIRSAIYAHEELVFIGPFENYLGDHIQDSDGVGILQAIARTNYRYLRARPGSVERARHELLFKRSGDRGLPGSFFESKLDGVALVREAVKGNAFALVRRSALLLAAQEGVTPHRIYREGDPALVLRLALVEVHPGKTRRPRRPGFYDFVLGEAGQAILARFGADRFGYPVYGPGAPPEGEGAKVPGLDASGGPSRPSKR
jgi:ABC-type tungstate transport system permease subunit